MVLDPDSKRGVSELHDKLSKIISSSHFCTIGPEIEYSHEAMSAITSCSVTFTSKILNPIHESVLKQCSTAPYERSITNNAGTVEVIITLSTYEHHANHIFVDRSTTNSRDGRVKRGVEGKEKGDASLQGGKAPVIKNKHVHLPVPFTPRTETGRE